MPGARRGNRWAQRAESAATRATSLVLAALAALALACAGGFETPDLDTGTVDGRLLNAKNADAYVYPFGRPDLRVNAGADGRFSLKEVPVETTGIVIVAPDMQGAVHANLQDIRIEGADRTELPDVDVSTLPLAGTVLAAVQPAGGAVAVAPTFTIVGTDQADVVASTSGTAALWPLPPGTFELRGSMAGFETATVGVQVAPAYMEQVIVPLPVDPRASEPGCASTGLCRNGLVCNPADGFCYECIDTLPTADADCAKTHGTSSTCSGFSCLPATIPLIGLGICEPCASDGECTSGTCATYGGDKFCSKTYATFGCPAGFGRGVDEAVPTRSVCVPFNGCAAHEVAMGSACFDDSTCSALFSSGSSVMGAPEVTCRVGTNGAGYCTGMCTRLEDCVIQGWTCSGGMPYGYCVPPTTPAL